MFDLSLILTLITKPLFLSLLISGLVTPLVIVLYTKLNLLDDPQKNKHIKTVHQKPVPRGGGIPILIAILVCSLVFLGIDKHIVGILTGALVLVVVGVFDDIFDLSPYLRLITTILAALFVVASGIGIAYITKPFGQVGETISLSSPQIPFTLFGQQKTVWVLSDFFALIWILWLSNIVNWSKGVAGQMPGFVGIAAFFIGLLSLKFATDTTQWEVATLAGITSGAYFGFLFFNYYPQKIMPGYGGGSLAGYMLAVLSILSGAKLAALVLTLGIPFADALITIFRRICRKKSPVWGDRGHLHHRLLDSGWSIPQISWFYWIATLILGILSLQLNSNQKLFTIALTILATAGLIIWLKLAKQNLKK